MLEFQQRFLEDNGSQTIDEYLLSCDDETSVLFYGINPFKYMWEKRILLLGDIIRINLRKGIFDEHYYLIQDGKLQGFQRGAYGGREGTFNAEDLLCLGYADNCWRIGSFALSRIKSNDSEGS